MGKGKLGKFEEMKTFSNVFQPSFDEVFKKDFYLKGKWSGEYFKNDHPIVLELGCGKGEYTVGLAGIFPGKNFIGIDIKGARIWKLCSLTGKTNWRSMAAMWSYFLSSSDRWWWKFFHEKL